MPSNFAATSSANITSHRQQHHDHQDQSLQTKKLDDKFFSRLVTKENSRANSSSRVYYGGAAGSVSVPFVWESQPGTPKHPLFSDTVLLPPLTPPPSYYNSKSLQKQANSNKKTLLASVFSKLITTLKVKNTNPTVSSTSFSLSTSSLSSSSSSSSSSYSNQPSGLKNNSGKVAHRECSRRQRRVLSCPTLKFHHGDDHHHRDEQINSLCFGGKRRSGSMKNNVVFSIAGHE